MRYLVPGGEHPRRVVSESQCSVKAHNNIPLLTNVYPFVPQKGRQDT